jgi:vancomycin aglycone glucosyltransferase
VERSNRTTAAALRSGIPTLIRWLWLDQPVWAASVESVTVVGGQRVSDATAETLVADLWVVLTPQYAIRAREVAGRMTKPAESLASTADLPEHTARRGGFG